MFPMQNFEPESAVIFVSSNSALIEKYLRNTCLGQGAVPIIIPYKKISQLGVFDFFRIATQVTMIHDVEITS